MTPAARIAAAIEILDEIVAGQAAEQALTRWARRSRFAGSKDRAAIRDHVFDALRHWRSDAARGGGTSGRVRMIGRLLAEQADVDALFSGEGHAPDPISVAERTAISGPEAGPESLDIPDWLWSHLQDDPKTDEETLGQAWQSRAPITLRANARLTDPDTLIARLKHDNILAVRNSRASHAVTVTEGERRLRQTLAFAEGHFDMQDGASQAVVERLPSGRTALDFCAGGGGKSLALAALGWQVTAHDAAPGRMRDLPARAARAGAAVQLAETSDLSGQEFDLVLCDAPCSGSGAWRRQPEGKWILTEKRLNDMHRLQGHILDQARVYVAPQGVLAYATCSVFSFENEAVIQAFLERNPEWTCAFQERWPVDTQGDGFFSAHLTREK